MFVSSSFASFSSSLSILDFHFSPSCPSSVFQSSFSLSFCASYPIFFSLQAVGRILSRKAADSVAFVTCPVLTSSRTPKGVRGESRRIEDKAEAKGLEPIPITIRFSAPDGGNRTGPLNYRAWLMVSDACMTTGSKNQKKGGDESEGSSDEEAAAEEIEPDASFALP
jgi:hypothetical protein